MKNKYRLHYGFFVSKRQK